MTPAASPQSATPVPPPHWPAAVVLASVSRLFGSFVAVRNVSLTLPAGTTALLLGANGSGKSTLLRLIAGLGRPSYGSVQVLGGQPEHQAAAVAYMGHQTMLYDELTGPENLRYLLGLHRTGLSRAQRTEIVASALLEVGLDPANPRRLAEYSQGMRQRASLARVLLSAPDLLLLDEPFSNLDVNSAHAMIRRLQSYLRQPGRGGIPRTLLLTTHQAQLAQPLAGVTLTLHNGALLDTVAAQPEPITAPDSFMVPPEVAVSA